jgi:uncharacterized membrane protein YgcG
MRIMEKPTMRRERNRFYAGLFTIVCSVSLFIFNGCTTTSPQQADVAPAPVMADDAPPNPIDATHRWPMRIDSPQGTITVYQPQVTKFDGNKLTARAAVSVIPPGQTDPTFGAIWMESRVSTDRVARTVQILDVNVTRARFPDAQGVTEQELTTALSSVLPQQAMTLSLDQLSAELQVIQKEKEAVKDLATNPPQIIFRDHPAVLVQFDGDPRLVQEANSNVLRAVNTPFFVALDPGSKTYFLKGAGLWFASANATGPFQQTNQVPGPIAAAADADGYKDPQQPLPADQAIGLEIVTATQPTELIWTDGPEELSPISNTDLLYVTNTDANLFVEIQTQQLFVLLSGRWYSAPNSNGPWTFVASNQLPPDFKLIPANSPKGDVLACVAGTDEAKIAVADTFVPQTAAIDRTNYEQPDVQYDGDPSFQPVEGVPTCSYAVNTPESVLLVDNQYYCCHNAVWYSCASPRGRWELCTSVPQVIYTIPSSCPVYSVRYCYVYEVTPAFVYCGYTPGYVGCYPFNGVVVYGTGFYYQPWIGHAYYPRPYTYGFAAHYDQRENHWGFAVGFAFGGGEAWFGEHDNQVARSNWFGHGGYRPAPVRDDVVIHRTIINSTVVHNDQWNVYERRKDVRPDVPSRTVTERKNPPAAQVHPPVQAKVPVDKRNNVFADPNGDVYRKTMDGWEQRKGNQWVAGSAPKTPTHEQAPPPDVHNGQPPREQPPYEPVKQPTIEPPKEAPKTEKPEPPAPPARSEPAEPNYEQPPANADHSDLNQEYRARVTGEQRTHSAPPQPAPPAPREPAPAPREPAPTPHESAPSGGGGGGGNGGGTHGGGGNGGGGGGGNNAPQHH